MKYVVFPQIPNQCTPEFIVVVPKNVLMTNGSLDKRVIIPTYYLMNHSKIKTNYTPLRGSQSNTLSPIFFGCNPASIHEPFAKVSHCSATASWALTNIVDHTSMYTYICLCMYKCCRRFYLLTTLDCFKKKSRGCGNCKVLKTQGHVFAQTCLDKICTRVKHATTFCQGFLSFCQVSCPFVKVFFLLVQPFCQRCCSKEVFLPFVKAWEAFVKPFGFRCFCQACLDHHWLCPFVKGFPP